MMYAKKSDAYVYCMYILIAIAHVSICMLFNLSIYMISWNIFFLVKSKNKLYSFQ